MRLLQIPLEELQLNYMKASAQLKWIPVPELYRVDGNVLKSKFNQAWIDKMT